MPRRQSKFLFACARLTRETTNRNPKTDSTLRFRPLDAVRCGPSPGPLPRFHMPMPRSNTLRQAGLRLAFLAFMQALTLASSGTASGTASAHRHSRRVRLNRAGFPGGHLVWVTRPRLVAWFGHRRGERLALTLVDRASITVPEPANSDPAERAGSVVT